MRAILDHAPICAERELVESFLFSGAEFFGPSVRAGPGSVSALASA
jgi:hypothetical protein